MKRQKKRAMVWVVRPPSPSETESEPPREWEIVDEQEAKTACELALFFMLLNVPRSDEARWYRICVEQSFSYPGGSYRSVFWWAMRILRDPNETVRSFREYLEWKLNEFESGRIRREGPVW